MFGVGNDLEPPEAVRDARPQVAQPRPVDEARGCGGADDLQHAAVGTVVDEERLVFGRVRCVAVAPGCEDRPEAGEAVARAWRERRDQGHGRLIDRRDRAEVGLCKARVEWGDVAVVGDMPFGVKVALEEREELVRRRQGHAVADADREDVDPPRVRGGHAIEDVVRGERVLIDVVEERGHGHRSAVRELRRPRRGAVRAGLPRRVLQVRVRCAPADQARVRRLAARVCAPLGGAVVAVVVAGPLQVARVRDTEMPVKVRVAVDVAKRVLVRPRRRCRCVDGCGSARRDREEYDAPPTYHAAPACARSRDNHWWGEGRCAKINKPILRYALGSLCIGRLCLTLLNN